MLILTRKSGEALRIGNNIKITLVEIKGNQARLGIEASNEIPVYREEIYVKVKDENRLSSGVSVETFKKLKEVITEK